MALPEQVTTVMGPC